MSPIFFDGDLRSGISIALQNSKFVACFIRDDGDESSKWETQYLGDPQVQSALTDRAITFRIQAGSEEAGFLAAYYPLSSFPALILIHNGVLALHLGANQDKATFKSGLMTTLVAPSMRSDNSSSNTEAPATSSVPVDLSTRSPLNREHTPSHSHNLPVQSSPAPDSQERTIDSPHRGALDTPQSSVPQDEADPSLESSSSSQQSVVQRLLQDRRRKLEEDKEKKKLEEMAERKAKADAQKKTSQAAPDSAKAKQATFAQEQRKRNLEARLERERVLRQIELDKIERKERDERRKALTKAEAREEVSENSNVPGSQSQSKGNKLAQSVVDGEFEARGSKLCAVQVRLFDGGTIRNKFAVDQTLSEIREWVDKERSDDVPFTFKQILTPLPNRSLTISEERERIIQLGFTPSATLVMVPIKDYTAAYTDSSHSFISKISALPLNTVTAGVGLVSGALGTFLGLGQAGPSQEDSSAQPPSLSQSEQQPNLSHPDSHVRTLGRQREDREEDQLYNGNQINVHPRSDDIDKDK